MESGQRGSAGRSWLVDGFNVLHAGLLTGSERRDWWRAEWRRRLLERAASFDDPGAEIWVVFDGPHPADPEDAGRVRLVFAPSADDWMLARVRRAANPARVTVVTRDRRLAERSRRRGAEVVAPRCFLERCALP